MHLSILLILFLFLGILTDFTSVTENYWMRDVGYSVESITSLGYIVNLPWAIRFVFGYIPDTYGHVVLSLFLFFIVNGIIWLVLATLSTQQVPGAVVFLLILGEIAPAAGLTIADTLMVKACKEQGDVIAQYCHGIRLIGKALAGYIGSAVLTRFGTEVVFYTQGVICFVFSLFLCICIRYDTPPPPIPEGEETTRIKEDTGGEAVLVQPSICVRGTLLLYEAYATYTGFLYTSPAFPFLAFLTCMSMIPSSGQAVFFFLSGPIGLPPTFFGLLDAVDLVSIGGTFFVWRSWSIASISYAYALFSVLMNLPMVWIIARQNVIDDGILLVLITLLSSFVSSMLITRFAIENAKVIPEGKEGVYYAFYSCIPGVGRLLGVLTSVCYTEYFHINHDDFDQLGLFNAICTILGCLVLWIPVYM
jgi:hypothetical protein